MGMSREEIQQLIDTSRERKAARNKRTDEDIKRMQAAPSVPGEEVINSLTPPAEGDETIMDYVVNETKVIGLTAVGAVELMAEFGSSMFGAFAGTTAQMRVGDTRPLPGFKGVLDALTIFPLEKPRPGFDQLKDKQSVMNFGDLHVENMQRYTDAMTYHPRTIQGQAASKFARDVFNEFSIYGDQAGDATYEATNSPFLAAAVTTAITGAPVWLPYAGHKVLSRRKANKIEQGKIDRRKELIRDTKAKKTDLERAKRRAELLRQDKAVDTVQQSNGKPATPIDTNIVTESTVGSLDKLNKLIEKTTPDTQKLQNIREQKKLDKLQKDLKEQEKASGQADLGLEEFPTKKAKPAEPHPDKGKTLDDPDIVARGNSVRDIQKKSMDVSNKRKWPNIHRMSEKIIEAIFESKQGLRNKLLRGTNKNQNLLLERYADRMGKASNAGNILYQDFELGITHGIHKHIKGDGFNMENFNMLADSMRTIEIWELAKQKNKTPPVSQGGKTALDHIANIKRLKIELGEKVFNKLHARVNELHKVYSRILNEYYIEGLISKKRLDGAKGAIYSPRQFLEIIDPKKDINLTNTEYQLNIFDKKVQTNDSGLRELNKGDIALMEMDQMQLLQEYTVRATNNIWRNQAAVKLSEWLDTNTKSDWIRYMKEGEKVPKNKGVIEAWIDGKAKRMIMDKEIALQWTGNNYIIGKGLSDAIRAGSLQWIMKPLTTGVNPEMGIKLFVLDLMHIHIASNAFHPSALVYPFQIGKHLAITMKDSFFRGPRLKAYALRGGATYFLTHQGTNIFQGKGILRDTRMWRNVKKTASYLNETLEIWPRLAIENKIMDSMKRQNLAETGVDTLSQDQLIEATARAVEQMDYMRGGTVTKAFDSGVAYLNVGTVAFSSAMRNMKRNPGRAAYQIAEMSTFIAAYTLWQELYFPEVTSSVDSETLAKNFIIPTGRSYRDHRGNVRHGYIQIRKDNILAGILNPIEMAVRNQITGYKPDDQTLAYFKSLSPVIPVDVGTPAGAMMHTFVYNHDFWGNPVWNDPELDVGLAPEYEYTPEGLRGPASSPFYRDLGRVFKISPDRLEASLSNIAPDNSFLFAGGMAYKHYVNELENPTDAQTDFAEQMKNTPVLRHFMKFTHPQMKIMEDSIRPRTRSQIKRKVQRDQLDQLMAEKVNEPTILQWAKQQPVEDIERLINSYFTKKALREIFNGKTEMSLNIPGPVFWNFVASEIKDPKEKAEVLYWKWRDMPTHEDRAMFMRISERIDQDKPIWPSLTKKHFREFQSDAQFGTEFFSDPNSKEYKNKGVRAYQQELELTREQEWMDMMQERVRIFDKAREGVVKQSNGSLAKSISEEQ